MTEASTRMIYTSTYYLSPTHPWPRLDHKKASKRTRRCRLYIYKKEKTTAVSTTWLLLATIYMKNHSTTNTTNNTTTTDGSDGVVPNYIDCYCGNKEVSFQQTSPNSSSSSSSSQSLRCTCMQIVHNLHHPE